MTEVRPFEISVSDAVLEAMRTLLDGDRRTGIGARAAEVGAHHHELENFRKVLAVLELAGAERGGSAVG